MADAAHQDSVLANGAGLLPEFEEDEDPDELLSDEDAPDLQDEIAKTLTSLKVRLILEVRNVCGAPGQLQAGAQKCQVVSLPIRAQLSALKNISLSL